MRTPHALLLLSLGAVLTFAATGPAAQLARPAAVSAQEAPSAGATRGITVLARGQASGQPDLASLSLGVEAAQPTADAALAQASAGIQNVLSRLDQLGVSRADVQTSTVNLIAVREAQNQPHAGQITGYRAINLLTVRVMDVSRVGEILDATVAAGANQVHGISFGLADPGSLHAGALQDAVQRARGEAQAIAGPLNLQVGTVLRVEEMRTQDGNRPPTPYAAAAASQTPVEPGQLKVDAEVQVTFAASPTS